MKRWKKAIIKIGCSLCMLSSATFFAVIDHAYGATTISADINTNTTWRPEGSPYIVTKTIYIRALNASDPAPTLTITPQKADGTYGAVEVRFYPNTSMRIGAYDTFSNWYGALDAQGTSQYPITFTANSPPPDPYTIPPNPQNYYWGNVFFVRASDYSKTKLKYCTFQYGGYSTSGTTKGNIMIENNNLFHTASPIEQCIFRYSYSDGIVLYGSYCDLKDCQVVWNQRHGIYCQDNSGGLLQHNDISHNKQYGVSCKTTTVSFTINSNIFTENGFNPLCIPPAIFDGHNTYVDNGTQEVLILGCQVKDTATVLFPHEGIPYRITGNTSLGATYTSGLLFLADGNPSAEIINVTIAPGVTMQFETGTWLKLQSVAGSQSTLMAVGTKEQPITLTASEPGQYWNGLYFSSHYTNQSASDSRLSYCIIEYAGNGNTSYDAAVYFEEGFPSAQTLINSTIRFSQTNGIKIYKQGSGTVDIHNNSIYNNALYDILDSNNSLTINAQLNYWGTPHGPSQDLCSSATVSNTVLYEAWLEQEFTDPFRFTAANASPKQFNPLAQHTTFSFTLSQSATWTLSVLNKQFEKVWSTAGTGSSAAIGWNGMGDNGAVSGTCYYRIEAQTGATIASPAMGMIEVGDQTIARITQPTSGTLFTPGTPITIAGTAQVGTGGYYEVLYGVGEDPTSWTTISGPIYASKQNEELAVWNTTGLNEPVYTIKLEVQRGSTVYSDVVRVRFYLEEQPPNADSAALYTYDALGRIIKVVYPDESWVSYTYDRVGNRTKVEHAGRNSIPTAIKLSSFSATPTLKGIIVRWKTETERNTAGFNLYRKAARENDYKKLNTALIASRGTATEGAAYSYLDIPFKVRGRWLYMLEEVEHTGKTKRYGPVSSKNIAFKRPNSMRAFRKSFKTHCDE
jgi:parallel beta-helix repeat protein/YD repeat-containing protein